MYKKMLELMVNGVPVEGRKNNRPFDIIDYFSLTQISYEAFYEKVKDVITAEETIAFKTFCNANHFTKALDLNNPIHYKTFQNVYSMKIMAGGKFDEKDRYIPGSAREISENTKPLLIDFLIKNNIPLCSKSIHAVQRRFLNRTLSLSKEYEPKKLLLNK